MAKSGMSQKMLQYLMGCCSSSGRSWCPVGTVQDRPSRQTRPFSTDRSGDHSEIGVTMNVYTHLGLEDATEELKKIGAFRKAQAESSKLVKQGTVKNNTLAY